MILPVVPVISVDAVRAVDADGVATVLDAEDYEFDPADFSVTLDQITATDHYEIDFTAGYGTSGVDVPQPLRQAIRLLVTHWYEHRSARDARRHGGGDAARLSRADPALPEDGAVLSERGDSAPGRLRHRVTLRDGDGDAGRRGRRDARVERGREPVGGDRAAKADERAVGEGEGDLTLHKIIIRKRDDVSAGDRFTLGARVFRIKSVTDRRRTGAI